MEKLTYTQGRWTSLLINHNFTDPYNIWQVWSIEKVIHTQGSWIPTNWTKVYRTLLHLHSMIYWASKTYPRHTDSLLIEHKSTEPYYTCTVWSIEKARHNPGQMDLPANQAQVYRALLHLHSMIYWESETYPAQMDLPANWPQVYRTLIHLHSKIY